MTLNGQRFLSTDEYIKGRMFLTFLASKERNGMFEVSIRFITGFIVVRFCQGLLVVFNNTGSLRSIWSSGSTRVGGHMGCWWTIRAIFATFPIVKRSVRTRWWAPSTAFFLLISSESSSSKSMTGLWRLRVVWFLVPVLNGVVKALNESSMVLGEAAAVFYELKTVRSDFIVILGLHVMGAYSKHGKQSLDYGTWCTRLSGLKVLSPGWGKIGSSVDCWMLSSVGGCFLGWLCLLLISCLSLLIWKEIWKALHKSVDVNR